MDTTTHALAPDTAIALGIASAAIPFASTPQAGAECWLRILCLYGESGVILRGLGVSEDTTEIQTASGRMGHGAPEESYEPDALVQIVDEAVRLAGDRGTAGITTADLLRAVMSVYGGDFDHALRAHGTTSAEVSEHLDGPH